MLPSELDQAIEAIQAGQKAQGLAILAKLVNQEPHNERAWLWLATCVDEPEKKRYCLQRVLELNPSSAAARQLLAELDAPAAPPPQETTPESAVSSLRDRLTSETVSDTPAQATEMPLPEAETPKPSRFGEWGVVLTTGLHAGLIGLILAVPLEFFGLIAKVDTTRLWAAYSVLWIGVGLIAGYLLHLRGVGNKISRAIVGAPAGCVTSLTLGVVAAFVLNVIYSPHRGIVTPADSPVFDFITSVFLYTLPFVAIGLGLGILGALVMVGILGAIEWVKEPERTEDG
jgi:hypothetical protein